MWGRALSLLPRRPLTGFGPGMFGLVYPSALEGGDLPLVSLHAHNSYVHFLVERGLLGLLSLLLPLALALRSLRSEGVAPLAAASGVAAVMVASMFGHSMEIPSIGLLVWGLVGVSLHSPARGRGDAGASFLLGAVLAMGGTALLPVIVKAGLAHRLYDRAREWRLPPLEACGVLRRAAELDPSMPVYWEALGEASFRAGLGPSEFLPPLERAVREAPFDPWARRLYYWGLYRAGRVREAAREAERACQLYPASGLFRAETAWLLSHAGRPKRALRLLSQPVHLTHKALVEFLLASLLQEQGQRGEARKARERMLHALRFYQPPSPKPFTAPYLRLPFDCRLPSLALPGPQEMSRWKGVEPRR